MSVITPSSNVTLLKCPLEMDNNHQLNFASKTAQYNYFNSLPKYDIGDDYTYIRQENVIRVDANIDEIMQYNYLMYQNEAYSNKWFYAYIVDMQYLNDNCTAILIKLDTWQTWQFDLQFRKCYVEREHVSNDAIGAHTVPEMLDYGPSFVCNDWYDYKYADAIDSATKNKVIAVFMVTSADFTYNGHHYAMPKPTYSYFNSIPQGCVCFGVELTKDNSSAIYTITGFYDGCGKADAIIAITLVPYACCEWDTVQGSQVTDCPFDTLFYLPKGSQGETTLTTGFGATLPSALDGYTPKNNKLFTSPYTYFYVSNNAGIDVTYRFEDFYYGGNTGFSGPTFEIKGVFDQGGQIYAIPRNSKISNENANTGDGYGEGIKGITLPNISWTSDYYLNWKAVNGRNVAIQTGLDAISWGKNIVSSLGSMAAGGQPTGSADILGFAGRVANTAQQIREAQMVPPQAKGNVNSANFAFSNDECKFTRRTMTIKAEYAKIIDDYLTMYGYKVNSLKVPNITGRRNWNYVKTIDANIIGNVPQDDIAEIKGYFDRGITIWHNPTTFLDYNQTNNIV